MTTRLGLVSDIHATPEPLKEALAIFQREGVDMIICPGDVAGYGDRLDETVALLVESQCQTILGNHDIWYLEDNLEMSENPTSQFFRDLPSSLKLTLEGKKVYMVHASPPESIMDGIRLLDENGDIIKERKTEWTERLTGFDYDVLIVGHTHQVFAEQLGKTLVINPGSTEYNHTCGILSLPDMKFQLFALSNKNPIRSWNWGLFFANKEKITD
jgi:putative phosphoesterase